MKVVTPQEMVKCEQKAYQEGTSEEKLMLSAGQGIAKTLLYLYDQPQKVLLLCGKGNNGGDGCVAGISLLQQGWTVFVWKLDKLEETSPLCKKFHHQLLANGGLAVDEIPSDTDLIVDAFFGTGFHGKVKAPYDELIVQANRSKLPIFSVDIPSGLDGESGKVDGEAINATATLFLAFPKQGFFLGQGWNHVGQLIPIDIGLNDSSLQNHLEIENEEKITLPLLIRDRHKYQAGYVVGWGGSPGMPGAPLMASLAALRSGAGIVKLIHPAGMEAELALAPNEIIRIAQGDLENDLALFNKATAVFFGPGLEREVQTGERLRTLLPRLTTRCVIDAGALALLAEKMCPLPKEVILTPHRAEMARLLGIPTPEAIDITFLDKVRSFCSQHQCHLLLKGAPSFLFFPEGKTIICQRGDPGMATAGAGDVLTGILAGVTAQKMPFAEALRTAIYLHGTAGEIAAQNFSAFSMIATDIIDALPEAFLNLIDE